MSISNTRMWWAFFLVAATLSGCSTGGPSGKSRSGESGSEKPSGAKSENVVIRGYVEGLETLIRLELNGVKESFTSADFVFSQAVKQGAPYKVGFVRAENGQKCAIENPEGLAAGESVTVFLSCSKPAMLLPFKDGSPKGLITAGDYNNDGNTDIALTLYTTAKHPNGTNTDVLRVLYGDGNLGFTPGKDVDVSKSSPSWIGDQLQTAKLNPEDGYDDLVLVSNSSAEILYGNPDLGLWIVHNVIAKAGLGKLFIDDVNRDGVNDLLGISKRSAESAKYLTQTYLASPEGEFTSTIKSAAFSPANPVGPLLDQGYVGEYNAEVGDFNLDGKTDVLAVFYDSNGLKLGVFEGDGEGHFAYPHNPKYLDAKYLVGSNPVQSRNALAVGDIDGDADLDLIIGVGNNAIQIMLGTGLGQFEEGQRITIGANEHLLLEDMDADGLLDIIAYNQTGGELQIAYGLRGGRFDSLNSPGARIDVFKLVEGSYLGDLAIVDLDGSVYPDLAYVELNGEAPGYSSGSVQILQDPGKP